jgi:tRNA 2-selenouridine synthase SelU
MLNNQLKARLQLNRPMTSITLRIPVDVVDSLKAIAPQRGFTGYQTLLKSYLSDGLRRDEAQSFHASTARLVQALKNRGVSAELIALAEQDLQKGQR